MNSNIPKPCPFCGNHATMKSICGYEYKIGCSKCDVFFFGKTPQEALDKWNRRHESTPEAAEPPTTKKPEFADDMLRAQGITTAHCGYCRHFSTHLECGGRMKGWQGHCISSKSTRTAVDADDYCPNFKDNRKG
ncbi:MAG: Lar family restriction alleviation protein [Alphaproteobacteria bacterium]|nr:Lar family restriction alleviation protein [Alphaproteobacteria bacterium]